MTGRISNTLRVNERPISKLILPALCASLLSLAFFWLWTTYDYVIYDVRFLEGRHITQQEFSIAIRGERIAYIGREKPRAWHEIDGRGHILAPGFLDTNACTWVFGDGAYRKILDGVTSFLIAHGELPGASAEMYGIKTFLNYGTTVGIIGFKKYLNDPKFDLSAAFREALKKGAYGISFSPEYIVESTPELIRKVCKDFSSQNIPISFHSRYSDADHELSGVQEALDCASLGNPVHLLHLSSTGGTFHPKEVHELIRRTQNEGHPVIYDFYPYTSWFSDTERARFQGDWKKRYRIDFTRMRVPGSTKSITEQDFNALMKSGMPSNLIVDSIPQSTVDFFALETDASLGSDSSASETLGHPRGAASFSKFIDDYIHSQRLPLEQVLYRFSTAAIEKFSPYIPGLRERGKIETGYYADLILWDEESIRPHATYEEPLLPSEGVIAAFVNGSPLVLNRRPVKVNESPGKFLRGQFENSGR